MQVSPLLQLIASGESETLDFKKTISSAAKIAKSLCAFANHKGGTLLIGVNDNKTLAGVQSEDEKYMLDLAAHFYCKPEIEIHVNEWEFGRKMILEAKIPEGKDKPYYAKDEDGKWWVYIRVKDKSLLASKVVVDVLKRNSQKHNSLIKFTRHEQSLLQQLEKKEKMTLKEICKALNISRWRAQKMIVSLIGAGIVRNHTHEKAEFFTLS